MGRRRLRQQKKFLAYRLSDGRPDVAETLLQFVSCLYSIIGFLLATTMRRLVPPN